MMLFYQERLGADRSEHRADTIQKIDNLQLTGALGAPEMQNVRNVRYAVDVWSVSLSESSWSSLTSFDNAAGHAVDEQADAELHQIGRPGCERGCGRRRRQIGNDQHLHVDAAFSK